MKLFLKIFFRYRNFLKPAAFNYMNETQTPATSGGEYFGTYSQIPLYASIDPLYNVIVAEGLYQNFLAFISLQVSATCSYKERLMLADIIYMNCALLWEGGESTDE